MGLLGSFLNWYRHSEGAKDFTLYVIFVTVFSFITFASKPGVEQFHLYNQAVDNFGGEGLEEVGNSADVIDFLKGPFIDVAFPEESDSGAPLDGVDRLYISGRGRFMGAYRLRQVRSAPEECVTEKMMTDVDGTVVLCQADYSFMNRDKEDFGPRSEAGNLPDGNNFTKPFVYQDTESLNTTISYVEGGTFASYYQDGYGLDIIPNIGPHVLAATLHQCAPLMQESIEACMTEQGVEYDVPEQGNANTAGMAFTSVSNSLADFAANIEVDVVVGDGESVNVAFRMHNPGGVALSWKLDDATAAAKTASSGEAGYRRWIDWTNSGVDDDGQIAPGIDAIADPATDTPGTDMIVKVVAGADISDFAATSEEYTQAPVDSSFTLTFVSLDGALTATAKLNVKYRIAAAAGRRRSMLEESSGPTVAARAVSGPMMALQRRAMLEEELQQCSEMEPLVIPSLLNIDACKRLNEPMGQEECPFPYIGFKHMVALMEPDRCGNCACKNATDAGCMASCSPKGIFEDQLDMLTENGWFDSNDIRAYLLDVSLFHQNQNLFQTVRYVFEAPTVGGVYGSLSVRTFKLYRYITLADEVVKVFEIIFVVIVLYYTIEEITDIKKRGCSYFNNGWNYLDWANLIIFYVVIGLRIASTVIMGKFGFSSVSTMYVDFPPIGFYANVELNVSSINFFLMYFKIFKYLASVPRMDSILVTVSKCAFDLVLFLIMFLVIMFGFAAAFYVSFGSQLPEFKSVKDAFGALMRSLLGDFDYQAMSDTNGAMAPVLFYSFNMLVFFILLNMFLAIICDSFAEVKEQQTEEDLNFYIDLKNKILKSIRELTSKKKHIHDLQAELEEVDGGADGLIDERELESALKNNPEALAILQTTGAHELMAKYDVTGDGMLDKAEMTQILSELASKEAAIQKEIEGAEEEVKEALPQRGTGGIMAANFDPSALNFDTTRLEERIDTIEGHVKEMQRSVAKKLSLMIDLMMSLSDQIAAVNLPGMAGGGGGSQLPGQIVPR